MRVVSPHAAERCPGMGSVGGPSGAGHRRSARGAPLSGSIKVAHRRPRSRWLKLASRGAIGHRRRAEVNGFFQNHARPLCGTLMAYRVLGPEPSSLSVVRRARVSYRGGCSFHTWVLAIYDVFRKFSRHRCVRWRIQFSPTLSSPSRPARRHCCVRWRI